MIDFMMAAAGLCVVVLVVLLIAVVRASADANMGRAGIEVHYRHETLQVLTQAQKMDTDAVYHGACVNCLNLKGNNQGEQMRYCLGCAMSDWSDDKPNRRIGERG